jgi:hypothetical protein
MPTNPQPDYDYSNEPDDPAPMGEGRCIKCKFTMYLLTMSLVIPA